MAERWEVLQMNELHELHIKIMEALKDMEKDETVTEEFRDGAYNVMYLVESFIKEKLEAYIEKAVKQYEDSQAKA